MISYVKGILDHKEPGHVIIDVSGLGYEVFIPLSTYEKLPALGNQVKLHTHHHIREDAMQLYGFISQEEVMLIFIRNAKNWDVSFVLKY